MGVSAVFEILYLISIGLVFLVFGFKFLYNYNRFKKAQWDSDRLEFGRSIRKWRFLLKFCSVFSLITIISAIKINIWFLLFLIIFAYVIWGCLHQISIKKHEYYYSRRDAECESEFYGIQPSEPWPEVVNTQASSTIENSERKIAPLVVKKVLVKKTIKDRLRAIE